MPLECFYNLASSIEDNRVIWRINQRLRDRITQLRQQIDPAAQLDDMGLEYAIADYLLTQLQKHPADRLVQMHWIAWLSKRSVGVTKQIFAQIIPRSHCVSFGDLFLTAIEAIVNPTEFFIRFDRQHCQLNYFYPTLKSFTDTKIKRLLIPKIRQMSGISTLGITNLALAARSSRRRVKEALQRIGYQEPIFSHYLLAWQCFQEFINSVSLAVHQFQIQHFQSIADRYHELSELISTAATTIDAETIRALLEEIGRAIRQLLDPPIDSLDCCSPAQEYADISLIENLSYQPTEAREINQLLQQFMEFISELLTTWPELKAKQMLFLRHGLKLTQGKMCQELGDYKQYQISRYLDGVYGKILSQTSTWAQTNLQIVTYGEALNQIEALLDEYYDEQIDRFFQAAVQLLDWPSREVLKLFYIMKLPMTEIAQKMHKSKQEIKDIIEAVKQWLSSRIAEQIQQEIQLQFQPQGAAVTKITLLTETKLETILTLVLQ
jgi:predicted DNA-binding protein YlxM (UPF0122 family)